LEVTPYLARSWRHIRPRPSEAMMGQVTEANDFDSVLCLLSGMRGAVSIRFHGEHVGIRLAHSVIGPVGIDHMTFRMDLDADVGPTASWFSAR